MLVSAICDAHGTVDAKLSEKGQSRRVALTVPNFMMALVQLAEIDLVATLPRHLVARHAGRFNLTTCPFPFPGNPTRCESSRRRLPWPMQALLGCSRPWSDAWALV